MNNSAQQFESSVKQFTQLLSTISTDASELNKFYFSTDATTKVDALSQGTDAATFSTGMTKDQIYFMIGCSTELGHFFGNAAVTQGDFLSGCEHALEKNKTAVAILSAATEASGERIKALAQKLILAKGQAVNLYKNYYVSSLGATVAAIPASVVIFGGDKTASQYNSAAVLLGQFINLMTNQPVISGDYLSTVLNWSGS